MTNTNSTHINLQQLRTEIAPLTILQRAELLQDLVNAFYEGSKFDYPGGEGLNGKNGPEREGIGEILNAATAYADSSRSAEIQARNGQ